MNHVSRFLHLIALSSSSVFLISALLNVVGDVEATHANSYHARNFHQCGPIIRYQNISYSSVVPQATMDYYFNLAFEMQGGWDSQCAPAAPKIARNPAVDVYAYVGPHWWVVAQCAQGEVIGCAKPRAGTGNGHEWFLDIFFSEYWYQGYSLHMTNHEFGHAMDMGDHAADDCTYQGVMSNCSFSYQWPTLAELQSNATYIFGP